MRSSVQGDARVRQALSALLRFYPSSFRRDVGQDLVETAVHRRSESVRRHPKTGALRFWLTEGARFVFDGLLERAQALASVPDEFRHAVRQLGRAPAQQALAVVTLALGVGATVSVFTLADVVVFRPLPYADAHALYLVRSRFGSTELSSNSQLNLEDLRRSVKTMAWIAGAYDRSPALSDGRGDTERVAALDVTSDYLPGLGARVQEGRPFNQSDYAAGAERVAIMSRALWQRRWNGNPAAIGAPIRLDDRTYTIVGVMAPSYRDPEPIESGTITDVWVPARAGAFKDRDDYGFQLIGRLADGVSLAAARDELTQTGLRLAAAYPENRVDGGNLDFALKPLHETTVAGARDRILLVLGAVLLLLVLACANAANLFLARGVTRSPELAVRSALGATRSRLALQLFLEASMIALIAGALGALVGTMGLRAFVAAAPEGIPRLREVTFDARAFLIVVALTMATAVAFGVLPALRGARMASAGGSGSARTTGSRQTQRLQSALVAIEVALSLVLVTGAALLLASFGHLLGVPAGFDAKNVTVVQVRPPLAADTADEDRMFYGELMNRAASLPGVTRAAVAFAVPGPGAGAWTRVTPDAEVGKSPGSEPSRAGAFGDAPGPDFFRFNVVNGPFFETLNIPLLAGRVLAANPKRAALEVVINEAAAKRFFPGVDRPLGRRLALGAANSKAPMREVVGIVGNVRQRGPTHPADPEIYLPHQQRDIGRLSLLIETADGITLGAETIRHLVRELAADVPVDRIEALGSRYVATRSQASLLASLLSAFAAVGLLLAAIGTYATVSHAFSRRVREVAIRLALGARAGRVFRFVVGRALSVAAIGIAGGLVLTFLLSRFLEGQLYGVTARDPLMTAGAVAGIVAAVVLAALRPAMRAASVDPNKVLRQT
jgi:predicted permease